MKLCVIPARGGSKRIPRKNIREFGGKPMIAWSIKAALDCGADGIIVPQVRTVDDVRAMTSDCRYPTGPRRAAPFNAQMVGPSTDPSYRKRGMVSLRRPSGATWLPACPRNTVAQLYRDT